MANSSVNMSDSLGMTGSETRELKLGPSFLGQGPLYHTIRYDFKPASVDLNKMATVEVNDKNGKEVLVTVPHADGAGVTHTVFKGSQSPIRRDCVLIIDKVTGEITLEKLHTSVIVKKTRPESSSKLSLPHPDLLSSRKLSPKHVKGRGNASPKPPTLGCIPKHSPLHASPNPSLPIIGEEMDSGFEASTSTPASETSVEPRSEGPYRMAQHHNIAESRSEGAYKSMQHHNLAESRSENAYKSVQHHNLAESRSENTYKSAQHHNLAESRSDNAYKSAQHHNLVEARSESAYKSAQHHSSIANTNGMDDLVGVLSDSSSGDSSSDGDSSDSSSEADAPPPTSQSRASGAGLPSAETILSDDLQLSDSASDSD